MKAMELFEAARSEDDIAEATVACVRRMAQAGKEKPKLKMRGAGRRGEWQRWEKTFAAQSIAKPFVRPKG